MKKFKISDSKELAGFFEKYPVNVFGIGVYAYNRLYLTSLPNYTILCLRNSLENEILIKDNLKILSLEKEIGEIIHSLKKNSTSIVEHELIQNYLKQFNKPYLVSYTGRKKFEEICKKNGWISAISSYKLNVAFEDKINFRRLLKRNGLNFFPEFKFKKINGLSFIELIKEFGKTFVVQYPDSGGGKGTFFIKSKKDLDKSKIKLNSFLEERQIDKVVVSKFVKGIAVSTSGVATRWGTFSSNLQTQIIDIEAISPKAKGNGLFCGHDWTYSQKIPSKINKIAMDYTKQIGDFLYTKGYKGFFGLDMIWDKDSDNIYVIECNPRLTGVMPTLDMIQGEKKLPEFTAIHLLEYIAENEDLRIDMNYAKIQKALEREKTGTHFFLSSKYPDKYKVKFNIGPGVYKIKNNNLKFIREGYHLKHIKNPTEFIITEIPSEDTNIKSYGRICRILTKKGVLNKKLQFNSWAEKLVKTIYSNIEFTLIEKI